jgi:hypothetical protein
VTPAQKWVAPQVQPVFNPQSQAIKSRLNGFAIDVYAFNYNNGAPVVAWPVNGANNQRCARRVGRRRQRAA